MPLNHDYLLLSEGDETTASGHVDFVVPGWLQQMLCRFTKAAYIEAEFFGGAGMQAAFVWEEGRMAFGPEISGGAINAALRQLGIQDEATATLHGLPLMPGKDPFDMTGLGRHRSVEGWLKEWDEGSGRAAGA
jgi:hypothetical protein